jgi:hypothetical protein
VKRLGTNYWRLSWIVLTNGVLVFPFFAAPLWERRTELSLHRVGVALPPFSYWRQLFASPWWLQLGVLVLLVGIVAELRRSILSPIFNLGLYVAGLILALLGQATDIVRGTQREVSPGVVLLFGIVPFALIVAVDAAFYVHAFRRIRRQGSD